ncbi:hypothetical protein ACFZDG_26285 [Kitasatospora xanthocidica]|uniref:hypothetical protein n=1 Tax=Kitasatospora xanthocidica TaxID=83382 RepID=UPI0036ECC632
MSTPRPDSAPEPGTAETVVLGAGAGAGPRPGEETVRLPREAAAAREAEETEETENATFLDPRVWGGAPPSGETTTLADPAATTGTTGTTEAPDASASASASVSASASASASAAAPEERPLAPGELRRFGPGVPPRAAAAWHGATVPESGRPRPPHRVWRWLAPLVAVLLALAAFLFWRHLRTPALAVTGVTVTTDPAGPGCAGTAVVTAAVETNGGSGTLRYRWLRSDGTASDELVQDVRSGAHRTDLVLRWSFEGQGSLQATATLQLIAPGTRGAGASFTYRCA